MVVPGHLIFLYTIHLMKGSTSPTPVFITFFLVVALLQVNQEAREISLVNVCVSVVISGFFLLCSFINTDTIIKQ